MALPDVGDESPSLLEWLTGDDGTSINFGRLARIIGGIIAGSFFGGWAAAISEFFGSWFIEPLFGLATWLDFRITAFAEGLALIGETSWSQSIAFTFGLGLLAPVFAFAMYLAMARVVAYIRKEVSE